MVVFFDSLGGGLPIQAYDGPVKGADPRRDNRGWSVQ